MSLSDDDFVRAEWDRDPDPEAELSEFSAFDADYSSENGYPVAREGGIRQAYWMAGFRAGHNAALAPLKARQLWAAAQRHKEAAAS